MDEILQSLNERIEKTRRQLYKAKSRSGLILVSRKMDALINLYMRLSSPPPAGCPDQRACLGLPPVDRGAESDSGLGIDSPYNGVPFYLLVPAKEETSDSDQAGLGAGRED